MMENRKEKIKKMNRNVNENHVFVSFDAKSVNESFARMAVMAFMTDMNPTLDELEDVKTAVSEAVTNAIIHGYGEDENCKVEMTCSRSEEKLLISIRDYGVGIENIEEARQPFFTTKPDVERTGMGFVFMETFMDEVLIESKLGEGTCVTLTKYIGMTDGQNDIERSGEQ